MQVSEGSGGSYDSENQSLSQLVVPACSLKRRSQETRHGRDTVSPDALSWVCTVTERE